MCEKYRAAVVKQFEWAMNNFNCAVGYKDYALAKGYLSRVALLLGVLQDVCKVTAVKEGGDWDLLLRVREEHDRMTEALSEIES